MFEIEKGKKHRAQKVCLYGPEGIGKSSFAAQFPRAVFIDTEGSTSNMDVARLPKPTSWTMLLQEIQYVKQNPTMLKTLVIDTVDWAEMLCIEDVCAKHGKKGIEDFGYGNGYVYVKEEFGRMLNQLSDVIDVGINVVLTAHSQIIKFEQPDEMGAYDRYQLKLGKKTSSQTAPLVKEWCDMLLFMNYKTFSVATDDTGKKHKAQGGVRTIYANHHPAWDAKNRHNLPDEFPMEYKHIAHIFGGQPQAEKTEEPAQNFNISKQQPKEENKAPEQKEEKSMPFEGKAAPPPSTDTVLGITEAVPKGLADLMRIHNVSVKDIQEVVGQRGYYPADTPFENYDPGFVEGVLIGAWGQVHQMIKDSKDDLDKIPF